MRILSAHNYYLQPGGEDTEFRAELQLLRSRANTVVDYVEHNQRIANLSSASVAVQTVWSAPSYAKIRRVIREQKIELVHCHNTFPLISPSVYYACRAEAVPVIQTLYNPRLLCPAASLYRDGKLCTECVGRVPWAGVLHACFHHSRMQTAVVATMLTAHRLLGTWKDMVSTYLAATEFYRDLYARGGLPAARIAVKPNFISVDPGFDQQQPGEYALFVGRMDPEKGIRTMLSAWNRLGIPLILRGSGQLEQEVRSQIEQNHLDCVRLVGRLTDDELRKLVKRARFLVWPSEGYYETFGFSAVESFAAGVPVIGSRIGVMQEIVRDGQTGLLFNPGDAADLAAKCQWLWDHPDECARMGANARREYEAKYTPERNYQMLMDIYAQAIADQRK